MGAKPTNPLPTLQGELTLGDGDWIASASLSVSGPTTLRLSSGARILWDGEGALFRIYGSLHVHGGTLERTGAWGPLVNVERGRFEATGVRFRGARSWLSLPEPRPTETYLSGQGDGSVAIRPEGRAVLRKCVFDKEMLSQVFGGTLILDGCTSEGQVVLYSPGTLKATKTTFSAPVDIHGGEATLKGCTIADVPGTGIEVGSSGHLSATDVTVRGAQNGVVIKQGSALRWEGGGIRACRGIGLHMAGDSTALLRGAEVTDCGTAGVRADDASVVRVQQTTLRGNHTGLLACRQADVILDTCVIEGNTERGLEADGNARLHESGCTVGEHTYARIAFEFSTWEGADPTVVPAPEGAARVAWVRARLEQWDEAHASRGKFLDGLGDLLAAEPWGRWFANVLVRTREEIAARGWPAVQNVLAGESGPLCTAASAALGIDPLVGEMLVVVRSAAGPLAGITVEGDAPGRRVWTVTGEGVLTSFLGTEATVAPFRAPSNNPIVGISAGYGRIAVWSARRVTLLCATTEGGTPGATVAEWTTGSEDVVDVEVTGEQGVDAYTMQTDGHPYDRCGFRRALIAGATVDYPNAVATGWGEPPVPGVVGVQPQREVGAPTVLLRSAAGRVEHQDAYTPTDRIAWVPANGDLPVTLALARGTAWRLSSFDAGLLAWDASSVRWLDRGTGLETSVWMAPEYVDAVVGAGRHAYVRTRSGLTVLRATHPSSE